MVAQSYPQEGTLTAEAPEFQYIIDGFGIPSPKPASEFDSESSQERTWVRIGDQIVFDNIRKVEDILRELDRNAIKIPNIVAIREYLYKYDDMLELVERVCVYTRWFFPVSTELSLEVYRDPEVDDEHLSLYVRQRPYNKNLMAMLKAITVSYLDELAFKSGWLSVTTDFRFPRYQHAV